MFVRVGEGKQVGPVFRVEAGEGGEDEDLFVLRRWVGRGGQVVELIVDNRRWSMNPIFILDLPKR